MIDAAESFACFDYFDFALHVSLRTCRVMMQKNHAGLSCITRSG